MLNNSILAPMFMTLRDHRSLTFCNKSNEITTYCLSWPSFFLYFPSIDFCFVFTSLLTVLCSQKATNIDNFSREIFKKGDTGRLLRVGLDVPEPIFSEHRFCLFLFAFWCTFGAFGSMLAAVGSLLVSFWLHVDRCWSFGSILEP